MFYISSPKGSLAPLSKSLIWATKGHTAAQRARLKPQFNEVPIIMTNPNTAISKFLSYVLRHHPESIGITLDSQGWVSIDTLLAQAAQHNRPISRAQLLEIVATNPKSPLPTNPSSRPPRYTTAPPPAFWTASAPKGLSQAAAIMCTYPPTSPPRKKSDNATANPSCCASTPPPCTPQGIRSI